MLIFFQFTNLDGFALYADYGFLYGRHSKYFSSPAEAKTVVELVLAKSEKVQGIKTIFPLLEKMKQAIKFTELKLIRRLRIKLAGLPVLQPSPTEEINQSAAITSANFTNENSTDSSEVKFALAPPIKSENFKCWF